MEYGGKYLEIRLSGRETCVAENMLHQAGQQTQVLHIDSYCKSVVVHLLAEFNMFSDHFD